MGKTKKFKIIFVCLALLAGAAAFRFHTEFGTYRIVEVYDGDTIAVEMEGSVEKIRMIGADTPETVDPRKAVQCFGPQSSAYTHSHLQKGMRVRLVADPLSSDRDRYDRVLRYVYLKDGTLYNQNLIRLGFARAYLGFPFSKSAAFKAAQTEAQTTKTGLWSVCH